MRRLWSHIVIAATSLLMVGATFATVVTNMNSNIEFKKGRELTFRINAKDDDGNPDKDYEFTDDEAVKETAKIMEKRLATADISRYKVETQGNDTLKVSFVQDTERQYEIIKNYLTFDATLAISNSKETVAYADEFLNPNKKAYLETTNGYPTVVIPIDKDSQAFKAVYEGLRQYHQKTRKHHKIRTSLLRRSGQGFLKCPGTVIILSADHTGVYPCPRRPLQSVSILFIAHYPDDPGIADRPVRDGVDDRLEIGASAGDHHGDSQHRITSSLSPSAVSPMM